MFIVAKITHRDLKPNNILLDGEHRTRIADFGSSRFSGVGTQTRNVGTPLYSAPEQYETEYDEKVDVYSFGLLFYEILLGKPVFDPLLTMAQLYRKVVCGERPVIPETTVSFVKSLIECCWSVNPVSRPSFDEILMELKSSHFRICDDVDFVMVERYVKSVEVTD
jgi:serine/threonine protein kinase